MDRIRLFSIFNDVIHPCLTNTPYFLLLLLLFTSLCFAGYWNNAYAEEIGAKDAIPAIYPDDGYETEGPIIPEPMLYDLARPLGGKKGELEVNTLGELRFGGEERKPEWGPEIEYVFKDGYAVEFEVPFREEQIGAYKLGLQGTIGRAFNNRYIHGWQLIGAYDKEERTFMSEGFYLFGYRFNPRWSMMNAVGLRQDGFNRDGGFSGLTNATLFYDISPKVVAGLECNLIYGHLNRLLLLPQVHFRLHKNHSLQIGAGIRTEEEEDHLIPMMAIRLIFAL